jgi:hypothetical protein
VNRTPSFATLALLAATLLAARESHALRCTASAPVETTVTLAAAEQLGRFAINRSPDGTLWFAARVMPGRFARRPRTRVVAGAFDLQNQRWIVVPTEIASLPGRAELPLAVAVDDERATILIARPRTVLLRTLSRSSALGAPIEWSAPRSATGPALLDARAQHFALLWRSPARLSFVRGVTSESPPQQPTITHVARRGSLAGGNLAATIAADQDSQWALFTQRSGALSLVLVRGNAVIERLSQPAHCPDHCDRVELEPTSDGAVVTFAMKVRGDRLLRSFWASRLGRSGHGTSSPTIPMLRGAAVALDDRSTAVAQLARPVILRAIERPVALTASSSSIARAVRSLQSADETLVVSTHERGAISLARVRCERSASTSQRSPRTIPAPAITSASE